VQALPAAPVPQSFPDAEEVTMQDADIANLGRNSRGGRGGAHDEDEEEDDEGRGGQRVQVQLVSISLPLFRGLFLAFLDFPQCAQQ
jgi:hypothetical protein